ncbi:uncharacterized protein LOC122454590 [Cervus canadensis]|uniref:uncharacterized protein LOC122454590 n=1 Tax=Cervus canadensis TaxID=1574408 RepID=UPI001C9E7A52|nr:uncharacterized protein LOC122454590 [Cervus canadensis]
MAGPTPPQHGAPRDLPVLNLEGSHGPGGRLWPQLQPRNWLLSRPHTSVRSLLRTRAFNPPQHGAAPRVPGPRRTPGPGCPPRTLTLHGSHQPDPRPLRDRPVLTSLRPHHRGSQAASVSDCPQSNIRTPRSRFADRLASLGGASGPRHIAGAEKPGRGLALYPVGRIQMAGSPSALAPGGSLCTRDAGPPAAYRSSKSSLNDKEGIY